MLSPESPSRFAQYFLREYLVVHGSGQDRRAHHGGKHANRISSCGMFRSPGKVENHLFDDGLYMRGERASYLRLLPDVRSECRYCASLSWSVTMGGAEVAGFGTWVWTV